MCVYVCIFFLSVCVVHFAVCARACVVVSSISGMFRTHAVCVCMCVFFSLSVCAVHFAVLARARAFVQW